MISALESLVIALVLALSPAEPERLVADAGAERTAAARICERYTDEVARLRCQARLERPKPAASGEPYPEQITRIPPQDPGMPDRFGLPRGWR